MFKMLPIMIRLSSLIIALITSNNVCLSIMSFLANRLIELSWIIVCTTINALNSISLFILVYSLLALLMNVNNKSNTVLSVSSLFKPSKLSFWLLSFTISYMKCKLTLLILLLIPLLLLITKNNLKYRSMSLL